VCSGSLGIAVATPTTFSAGADVAHWQKVARVAPRISWLDRTEAIAHLIRENDVVCDLGCGAQALREFLPPTAKYIPVDCVKEHPDTWVADFDADYTLPDEPYTVFVANGLLKHLSNPDKFLSTLAARYPGRLLICSISEGPRWLRMLERYATTVGLFARLDRMWIIYGTLATSGTQTIPRRSMTELVCAYTIPPHYIRHKIALAMRLLRRGGNNGTWG
jgi:hypothetical protein